jgi:hypothetical protein
MSPLRDIHLEEDQIPPANAGEASRFEVPAAITQLREAPLCLSYVEESWLRGEGCLSLSRECRGAAICNLSPARR